MGFGSPSFTPPLSNLTSQGLASSQHASLQPCLAPRPLTCFCLRGSGPLMRPTLRSRSIYFLMHGPLWFNWLSNFLNELLEWLFYSLVAQLLPQASPLSESKQHIFFYGEGSVGELTVHQEWEVSSATSGHPPWHLPVLSPRQDKGQRLPRWHLQFAYLTENPNTNFSYTGLTAIILIYPSALNHVI